ncbi:unnamed protein product [Clonostachys solani]|uniref:Uncharacterized protein n=1 Tax=Clonostachys solani TaxID=160281 RepID=A0A9N9ZIA4_9HYPO|nr:unnamed protein product [Clonostachys solani]
MWFSRWWREDADTGDEEVDDTDEEGEEYDERDEYHYDDDEEKLGLKEEIDRHDLEVVFEKAMNIWDDLHYHIFQTWLPVLAKI